MPCAVLELNCSPPPNLLLLANIILRLQNWPDTQIHMWLCAHRIGCISMKCCVRVLCYHLLELETLFLTTSTTGRGRTGVTGLGRTLDIITGTLNATGSTPSIEQIVKF